MSKYKYSSKRRRIPLRIPVLLIILAVLVVAGAILSRHIYYLDLQPVSDNSQTQIFTVNTGSSTKVISDDLNKAHLIRSAWAFQLYVHSKELGNKLQAGTYALAPNKSTPEIVAILTRGQVATRLVTILPGTTISQIRANLINYGFKPADVDAALVPDQYSNLPVMAFKPTDVNTLEGLLWPDSWYKDAASSASDIVRQSLEETGKQITPDIQASFASENLTVYQGITLASIVIKEVNKPADQAQAAQVFLSRLKTGMMLGSDVTAQYGAVSAGKSPSDLSYDSPYNTTLHTGLPPTPISTINSSSLNAVAHPANTNWLYFVTGDNGNTYFSTNLQDHQALTQQYCHKLCGN